MDDHDQVKPIELSPVPTKISRREPYYVSDDVSIGTEHFYIAEHYKDTIENLLVPHGMIVDRVEKLAYDISQDYQGETIHLLCVLKGGSTFFQNLCDAIRKFHDYARMVYIPYTFDFIRVKSYEGTNSTGIVQIDGCDVSKLTNRHVLFVEDIIDTGLTMTRCLQYMNDRIKPASVKLVHLDCNLPHLDNYCYMMYDRVASLVEKRTDRSCGFKADYVGFSIPDKFVIGYCLDYNEVYRDLPHLAVINKFGMEKFQHHDKIY